MGGSQNYGPFWGPEYSTAPTIWGAQKGTPILTTTQIAKEHHLLQLQFGHTHFQVARGVGKAAPRAVPRLGGPAVA